jgi:uncharacterized metal-binding protein YceD (DUF177 family)
MSDLKPQETHKNIFKRLQGLSWFEAEHFWKTGFEAEGEAELEDFPRMVELQTVVLGPIQWFVKFWIDDVAGDRVQNLAQEEIDVLKKERRRITVGVNANIEVVCDRCLEANLLGVDVTRHLILTDQLHELDNLDVLDDYDSIFLGETLDVVSLIEDELLFSVPTSFVHDDCNPLVEKISLDEPVQKPFANLKDLLKH